MDVVEYRPGSKAERSPRNIVLMWERKTGSKKTNGTELKSHGLTMLHVVGGMATKIRRSGIIADSMQSERERHIHNSDILGRSNMLRVRSYWNPQAR
jgi:hypothetical protein